MKHSNLYISIIMVLIGSVANVANAVEQIDNKPDTNELPTIHLTAEHASPSYTVAKSKSATKLDLALKETPQTISVITEQRIQDQNLNTVEEVLDQTPGVYVRRFGAQGAVGNGGEYTFYYSRGNQILNYQIDGVMTSPATSGKSGSSLSNLNPIIYDNITVVKGATGLTNGAGYPSASVSLNRKHATSVEPKASMSIAGGSNQTIRSSFDVQGALNESGDVRGRLIAAYGQGDSWRDWGDQSDATLYGVIDSDLAENTSIAVGAMLSRARLNGQGVHGLDMYGQDGKIMPFDREFNASAKWAYSQVDTLNFFTQLKHQFLNRWNLQANYNYTKQDIESLYGVIGVAQADYTNMTASLAASQNDFAPEEHSLDISIDGPYRLFGREHELMMGASYQKIKSYNDAYQGYNAQKVIDLNQWNGNVALPATARTVVGLSNKDYEQSGFYFATRLNPFDPLHVILGTRLSNYDLKTHSTNSVRNTVQDSKIDESKKVTPYAGITFDLTPNLTAYASYTNIFLPQDNRDYSYNFLDPQEGDNYEAGLKSSFYDNRLNISAAYFQAKMDNVAESAGKYVAEDNAVKNNWAKVGDTYYRSIKGATTKGYEIEIAGQILPNWSIQAGYTLAETKNKGERINTDIPKQQFKLFTTYSLPILDNKLIVGGGVNWQSEFYDKSKTGLNYEAYRQKSFALVDLMARYNLNENVALGFNVDNLTDKKYRTNTWANTYGDPRTYMGSITFKY